MTTHTGRKRADSTEEDAMAEEFGDLIVARFSQPDGPLAKKRRVTRVISWWIRCVIESDMLVLVVEGTAEYGQDGRGKSFF
jgi:hypothetical protein